MKYMLITVRIVDDKRREEVCVTRCIERDLIDRVQNRDQYLAMHFDDAVKGVLAAEAEQQ